MSTQGTELEPTGEPAVDEAVRLLDGLDERAVDEHVAVFEQVHATLRETLSRPVDAPAQGADPGSAPAPS